MCKIINSCVTSIPMANFQWLAEFGIKKSLPDWVSDITEKRKLNPLNKMIIDKVNIIAKGSNLICTLNFTLHD